MALGHEWCCNDYGVISYIIRISLSLDYRDAHQERLTRNLDNQVDL